jgi:hypothetical protein
MKNILVTFAAVCFASSAFAGAPRVTTPGDVYQQDWKAAEKAKAQMNGAYGATLTFQPPTTGGWPWPF